MTATQGAVPSDPPLTTGQVAKKYGVNRSTVRRWADAGLISYFTTPTGRRRFHAADIDREINAGPTSQTA